MLGRLIAAGLTLVVAVGCGLPWIGFDFNAYDEGVIALGGEQVLQGRVPMVDFYSPYPPGAFLALAVVYRVAGISLVVERWFALGLVGASVALGCLLVSGVRPDSEGRPILGLVGALPAVAVAAACLTVDWVTPVAGGALGLVILGGLALRAGLPHGGLLAAAGIGSVFGIAALWRADFALYGAGAAALVWLLRARAAPGAPHPWRHRIAGALLMALGAAVVALPVLGTLLMLGGERAFKSLIGWPILSTAIASLPWPPLVPRIGRNWPFYFPLAALALVVWRATRWRSLSRTEIDVGLWLLLASSGFLVYAAGRTDYLHLIPLLLLSLLLSALCIGGALGQPRATRSERQGAWLGVGLVLALPALALLLATPGEGWLRKRLDRTGATPLPGARGAGVFARPADAQHYREVLQYLAASVPPGEPLFSGTPRHDVFMTNDVLLYFLAERDPGTYFWCLDAGVTTNPEVQREMVEELSTGSVEWVVRWLGARMSNNMRITDPRAVLPGGGLRGAEAADSPLLDRVLATEFVPVMRSAGYEVLRRAVPGH